MLGNSKVNFISLVDIKKKPFIRERSDCSYFDINFNRQKSTIPSNTSVVSNYVETLKNAKYKN